MSKKLSLLLDLDQTVISSVPAEDISFRKYKTKAKKFDSHNMDGYYIVFERPGLQKFLDWIFANYTVSVWTAASKDYALFIIDRIILKKPDRKIDFVFFSYHCDLSERMKNGSKDLSIIPDIFGIDEYHLGNTMILDDYDHVHNIQPGNCIRAVPFEFMDKESEEDGFLEKLVPRLELLNKNMEKGSSLQEEIGKMNSEN